MDVRERHPVNRTCVNCGTSFLAEWGRTPSANAWHVSRICVGCEWKIADNAKKLDGEGKQP